MHRRILTLALLFAAVVSASLVLAIDSESDATDSERETVIIVPQFPERGMDDVDMVAEFERLHHDVDRYDSEGKDVRVVMDMPPFDDPGKGRLVDHMMHEIGMEHFMFGPAPEMPPKDPVKGPAEPQMMIVHEEVSVPADPELGSFDPEFVQDVIDFALENGMDDLAARLAQRLAETTGYLLKVSNTVNALDTRASGLELDTDSDDDIEVVEDDEDEEDPMPYSPIEETAKPFLGAPVILMDCILLLL